MFYEFRNVSCLLHASEVAIAATEITCYLIPIENSVGKQSFVHYFFPYSTMKLRG